MAVTAAQARRFMLRTLGLAQPFENVGAALAHHGFVQLDPINVCGRIHDLILRNRVAGYREGDLLRHLHGNDPAKPLAPGRRVAFEHYLGVLTALPVDAWPYLAETIRARARRPHTWWGKLSRKEEKLAAHILATLAERGPLSSDDIEHAERAVTAWNSTARFAKVVLEKLFVHGRVLITTRRAFRRVYDLPERVLPPRVLTAVPPTPDESRRWQIETTLRQRRLVRLARKDLRYVEDLVQPVRVHDGSSLYCLRSDVPAWEEQPPRGETAGTTSPVRLLAPLDPLIYDREVTRRVWDFDYTWEVYTPAAKRVRGYYALPVLSGESIAGHVDPRADRAAGRLVVVSRRVKRGIRTVGAIGELAGFLGLRR